MISRRGRACSSETQSEGETEAVATDLLAELGYAKS